MAERKPDLTTDDIYHVKEGVIYRIVCAPKTWSKEKVQEQSNEKFGRPGTSANEWVMSQGDSLPENWKSNPAECESDDRNHWLMNC